MVWRMGKKVLANINLITGRSFVTKSLNTCKISKLGEGAAYVKWDNPATLADIQEYNDWAADILGAHEVESHIGGKVSEGALVKGLNAYREWKRKLGL
jgi:hypothetical protein